MAEVIGLFSVGAHMSGELGQADVPKCLLAQMSGGLSSVLEPCPQCVPATLQHCTGSTHSDLLHAAADWQVDALMLTSSHDGAVPTSSASPRGFSATASPSARQTLTAQLSSTALL